MSRSPERLLEERDAARRELAELRAQIDGWRAALRVTGDDRDSVLDRPLPPGAHLAAPPQRYTDNYQKYLERGGVMRPDDDVAGFVRGQPRKLYDRARFYFFCLVIDLVVRDKLGGDLVELGVDKGNTASVLARAAERLGKRIYLLDTFEGFAPQDLVGDEARHRGGYSDASLDLARRNVPGEHVRFVKGYFPDTAAQLPGDVSFCIVHLDCDLYKPFAAALQYFWPRLVPGGFLIMHDYTTLHWEGVEKAVEEFFATTTESIIPIPDMAGTVAVRKGK